MARQNNRKKIKLPGMGGDLKEAIFGKALAVVCGIIFIVTTILLTKAFLYGSDYFKLKVAETRAAFLDQKSASIISNRVLDLYVGQNIFKIPLKFISQSIQSSYADVREAVVRIVPPDRIIIDIKLRKPIALAHNVRYYPVDEEGVVLPAVSFSDQLKDLPVIDGIDLRYGRKASPRNLKLAIELLGQIRQSKFMAQYGILSINASDMRSMSFIMKNGIEVRIGSENFKERLEALNRTMRDPRLIVDRVKYIDLRFEDVAIGPK